MDMVDRVRWFCLKVPLVTLVSIESDDAEPYGRCGFEKEFWLRAAPNKEFSGS